MLIRISALERDAKVRTDLSPLHGFTRMTAQVACDNTSQEEKLAENNWKVLVNHGERSPRHHWLLHPHANGRVMRTYLIETVRVETAANLWLLFILWVSMERRALSGDPFKETQMTKTVSWWSGRNSGWNE